MGLGTQDSLSEAKEFVARHDLSVRMLWDASSRSWREFGVFGQPAAVLLSTRGEVLRRWFGMFDEAEVLELAGASSTP